MQEILWWIWYLYADEPHLAQHLNAVQLAFAHNHQSHSHTPILVQTGKCDISTLQMWDILTLRLQGDHA